jgi:hypothetical protein
MEGAEGESGGEGADRRWPWRAAKGSGVRKKS